MSNHHHELVIIGTGPAGLTAAIYASRANLNPIVFEGHEPGGQLTTTTDVENFPGFPEGVSGPELMANMKAQAGRFGTKFITEKITDIDLTKRPFKITSENDTVVYAAAVIISTGASAKYLGLPNEKELIGRGVSACATCDGFFYRDRIVHIVGGGDTALEEANFLTKFAKKVTIVHRRDEFRASKPMQKRTFDNPKIDVLWNSAITTIKSDASGVTGLIVENLQTKEKVERPTDGLFVAIGHTPNTGFLKGQLPTDEQGFIVTNGSPETKVAGIFACGDVQDPYYRQAISAAGSGCQAAIRAERYLEANPL